MSSHEPTMLNENHSKSELAFKAALEKATGLAFSKVRPHWLCNPRTGALLELDMFNEARALAIEYDGPQHYEFPNEYHIDHEQFQRQQERDRVKDELCARFGVTLVRVRPTKGSPIREQVMEAVGQLVSIGVIDEAEFQKSSQSSLYSTPPRYATDDHSAAVLFLEGLKEEVRKCGNRYFVRDGHIWTDQEGLVSSLLLERCLTSNIMRINEESGDVYKMSSQVPAARRIIDAAKAIMPRDPNLDEKIWRSNVGVICFSNGLWDFRRNAFFAYDERPDVMPRLCIPRDFPVDRPPKEALDDLRRRVLFSTLGDEDKVDTYLRVIARATAGEYADKQWVIMKGERNCGKGLLQSLNEAAWGPYVNTVNANAFLLQQQSTGDAAKSLSWALDCEHTRQTYTNEVKCEAGNRNIKLDGNLLKSFQSGGDVMCGRKNYQDERPFRVGTKLIMNLNDVPNIAPQDAASTMLLFRFPFKFVPADQIVEGVSPPFFRAMDKDLKTDYCLRPAVLDAFTWLVIDAYNENGGGPVRPCASVAEDVRQYLEDVGDDLTVMMSSFRITGERTDIVTIRDLKEFAASRGISLSTAKDRLERMGARKDANCCAHGVRHGRGFVGVLMDESSLDDV